jgi:hypothetical protein
VDLTSSANCGGSMVVWIPELGPGIQRHKAVTAPIQTRSTSTAKCGLSCGLNSWPQDMKSKPGSAPCTTHKCKRNFEKLCHYNDRSTSRFPPCCGSLPCEAQFPVQGSWKDDNYNTELEGKPESKCQHGLNLLFFDSSQSWRTHLINGTAGLNCRNVKNPNHATPALDILPSLHSCKPLH